MRTKIVENIDRKILRKRSPDYLRGFLYIYVCIFKQVSTLRMFKKLLPAVFLTLSLTVNSYCGVPIRLLGNSPLSLKQTNQWLKKKKNTGGLNVKILPAMYWGTLGFEVEYCINGSFSLGLNVLGTLGRQDGKNANQKVKPEDHMREGWRTELALKYYFKKEGPEGLYASLNFTYNEIFYYDGNTRPYTLHNRWKEIQGLRLSTDFREPLPYSAGVGFGYQLVVIPEKIIANVMIGVQGHIDADNNPFIAVYAAPTIGYRF